MTKWLEVTHGTDAQVAKLAAAHIITRVNHPSNVVQVGDQVYVTGVTKEDYGIGSVSMNVRTLDQLPAPAQDIVRRTIMSQYDIPGPKDEIKKSVDGAAKPLPVPGEGGDHVLSQAAKKVAKAVIEHAKANMQGVSGAVSDRAKKSIHDLYAHYVQGEWEKVLGAAQRYMRNMQGRGNPAAPTPTAMNESPVKLPKSPKMQKSLVPFKGAPVAEAGSDEAENEGLFHDFGKFADRHGRTEHKDMGAPTAHSVSVQNDKDFIHLNSETKFGNYGERQLTHEHKWIVQKRDIFGKDKGGKSSHKEMVSETHGNKSVRMGKEDEFPHYAAVRAHMNSLYTHVKDAPPTPDVTKLGKSFEGSVEDLQKALEPVRPIMKNAKAAAGIMGSFTKLAMRHRGEFSDQSGTPDPETHHMSVFHEEGKNPTVHMISDVSYDSGNSERHHYKIGTSVGSKGSYEHFVHNGNSIAASKGVGLLNYHKSSFSSAKQVQSHMDDLLFPEAIHQMHKPEPSEEEK